MERLQPKPKEQKKLLDDAGEIDEAIEAFSELAAEDPEGYVQYIEDMFHSFSKKEQNFPTGNIRHAILPGMIGESDEGIDDKNIIRTKSTGADSVFYQTPEHLIVRAEQGSLWEIPYSENPVVTATISECSLVVGKGEEDLLVAHIPYSEKAPLAAVAELFDERQVPPEDRFAIVPNNVSNTSTTSTIARSPLPEYANYNIPPENTTAFTCDFVRRPEGNMHTGILAAVITPSSSATAQIDQATRTKDLSAYYNGTLREM